MLTGAERLKAFAKSPQHAWLGVLTVGLGLATASPLIAILGAAAYGLGWVFLPDSTLFKNWLAKKKGDVSKAEEHVYLTRREKLEGRLSSDQQERYRPIAQQVDAFSGGKEKCHPLDGHLLSYLQLLHEEQKLEKHVDGERDETLEKKIAALSVEVTAYENEVAELEATGKFGILDTRRRLLDSHRERLDVLERRLAKLEESQAKLELVRSEQRRVEGLVKLLAGAPSMSSEGDSMGNGLEEFD